MKFRELNQYWFFVILGPDCLSWGFGYYAVLAPIGLLVLLLLSSLYACQGQYPSENSPVLLSFSSCTIGGLPLLSEESALTLIISRPANLYCNVLASILAEPPTRSFYEDA